VWKDEGWAFDTEFDAKNPYVPFVEAVESEEAIDEEELMRW
jgi:hypothetical protein